MPTSVLIISRTTIIYTHVYIYMYGYVYISYTCIYTIIHIHLDKYTYTNIHTIANLCFKRACSSLSDDSSEVVKFYMRKQAVT